MRSPFVSSALVALVSVPAFLVGDKLRQGDSATALTLSIALLMVVAIASALMRVGDREGEASQADARDRF
ncbi:MAG: hypothetical protein RLZZ450_2554 [Pseudomonadota bacterium]|jgi:hypothetical protein